MARSFEWIREERKRKGWRGRGRDVEVVEEILRKRCRGSGRGRGSDVEVVVEVEMMR